MEHGQVGLWALPKMADHTSSWAVHYVSSFQELRRLALDCEEYTFIRAGQGDVLVSTEDRLRIEVYIHPTSARRRGAMPKSKGVKQSRIVATMEDRGAIKIGSEFQGMLIPHTEVKIITSPVMNFCSVKEMGIFILTANGSVYLIQRPPIYTAVSKLKKGHHLVLLEGGRAVEHEPIKEQPRRHRLIPGWWIVKTVNDSEYVVRVAPTKK